MDSKSLKRLRSKYYVASKRHPVLGTPCWIWTGAKWKRGYGCFNISSKTLPNGKRVFKRMSAHKALYEHVNGPVPEGLELDHLCRNPSCVNPAHLEPVTHAENVKRGEAGLHNPVKTHCPHGHAYDEVGYTIINDPRGSYRRCKRCHADRAVKYRAKKKAAEAELG